MGSASLSNDGVHGGAFDHSLPWRCKTPIPLLGGRRGKAGGPPSGRGGAPSRQLQIHGAQSEGWAFGAGPSRGTWSFWYLQKEVLFLFGSPASSCLFTPLFVNWKTSTREDTVRRAEVNGTEVVQGGTNVPYCGDERLQIGTKIRRQGSNAAIAVESPLLFEKARDSPHVGLQATTQVFFFCAGGMA